MVSIFGRRYVALLSSTLFVWNLNYRWKKKDWRDAYTATTTSIVVDLIRSEKKAYVCGYNIYNIYKLYQKRFSVTAQRFPLVVLSVFLCSFHLSHQNCHLLHLNLLKGKNIKYPFYIITVLVAIGYERFSTNPSRGHHAIAYSQPTL